MAGDRVRDEAERLVAAALAMLSSATRGRGGSDGAGGDAREAGGSFATGSAECCICPVCRTIAAMRDPSSDLADRLASGVGDLAASVSGILRTLAGRPSRAAEPEPSSASEGDEFWENLRRKAADAARAYGRPSTAGPSKSTEDDPWRIATREPEAAETSARPEPPAPRPAPATTTAESASASAMDPPAASPSRASRATAVKKVAKKAVKKTVAAQPAGTASEAAARKPVAKKAVKKAATPPGGTA